MCIHTAKETQTRTVADDSGVCVRVCVRCVSVGMCISTARETQIQTAAQESGVCVCVVCVTGFV